MFVFNYDFNQAPWYQHPCSVFDWFSVYGNPAESALTNQAHNPPPTYTPLPVATFQNVGNGNVTSSVYRYNPVTAKYDILLSTTDPRANIANDPGLTNQYTNQFFASIEREVLPNFGIDASFVYKDDQRIIGILDTRSTFAAVPFVDAFNGVTQTITVFNRTSSTSSALNVTANFQLIRCMEPLLRKSDAGRAVFVTSGVGYKAKAYLGPYAASKSALDTLVRVWAAETATTPIRVNLFSPGPIRTRMRAAVMPGEDPMTLDTPEQAAEFIVPMCLPSWTETGKLYEYPLRSLLTFRPPSA